MARILIVEDEESSFQLIARFLSGGGHSAAHAFDGQHALDMMKSEDFDLVVTDLAMPRFNGLRLIREIRSSGDTLPIIALSGKNADQLLLAQDYGANAAVAKPVNGRVLLDLVTRILEDNRGSWASAWIHPEFGSVDDR